MTYRLFTLKLLWVKIIRKGFNIMTGSFTSKFMIVGIQFLVLLTGFALKAGVLTIFGL